MEVKLMEYCKMCEQEVKVPGMMDNAMGSKTDAPVKFKDGIYCYHCAKIKIDKHRKP